MEQYNLASFPTDSQVSTAPETQDVIDKIIYGPIAIRYGDPMPPFPDTHFESQFHPFLDTQNHTLLVEDPNSYYNNQETQHYNPSQQPNLDLSFPSGAPTPYTHLIPSASTSRFVPTHPNPADEKAVLADSESYLTLYKSGKLEARVNEKGAWELRCPAGCWVRTSVPGRIPLTTKGQFTTLEAHVHGKSCKGNAVKSVIQESRAVLASVFPAVSLEVTSPAPLPLSLFNFSAGSTTHCCPGFRITDWPGLPDMPIYANFPWLRTREGPDKLPFEIELVSQSLFARSPKCAGFLDTNDPQMPSCFSCSTLAPKIAILAKNAAELNPHTRRTLHTPVQLLEVAKHLDEQLNTLKLQGVNDSRKIQHLQSTLSDNSALVMALSQQDVPYLRQLLSTSLKNGASVKTILRTLEHALEHGYRPRNHKQESLDLAALIYRLGGRNLLYAVTQRFPLPSLRTLRNHTSFVRVAPTVGRVTPAPIVQNLNALLIESRSDNAPCRGVSLLIDETALEEAAVYIPECNAVGGLCWLHAHNVDTTLHSYQSALNVAESLREGKVHLAKEVTVVVARLFGEDGVYPLFVAPTCKREQACNMEFIIGTVIDVFVANGAEDAVGPLWSLATDGDATRRKACHQLLLRQKLAIDHPIYGTLSNLPGLNLYVGPHAITLDPDFKHNIKRCSTSLRSRAGIYINSGHCINTFMLERYLTWVDGIDEGASRRLLYPDDPQDVPRAVELLTAICKLGRLDLESLCGPFDLGPNASTIADFDALYLLSHVYESLVEPYVDIHLSLSQQVTSLSRLAHLLFACYRDQGRRFIPNQLYYDLQSMIKCVVFNVAKQQKLDPSMPYAVVEGGDDALESLFAFLRMSGGHHSNLNYREAIDRLGAARDIADIFSRNPDLNSGHRRLNVKRKESVDHISRSNWTGDIISGHCDLPSSWRCGQEEAIGILSKSSLPPSTYDFDSLFSDGSDVDLLQVFGSGKYPSIDGVVEHDANGDEEAITDQHEPDDAVVQEQTMVVESIHPAAVDVHTAQDHVDLDPSFEDELSNALRALELGPKDSEDEGNQNVDCDSVEGCPPKGPGIHPADYLWCDRRWVHKQSVCRIIISPHFTPKSHDRLMRVRGFTAIHKQPYIADTARVLHGDQFIVGDIFLSLIRTQDKKLALALLRATAISESGVPRASINVATLMSLRGNVKITGDIMVLMRSQNKTQSSWVWNGGFSNITINSPNASPTSLNTRVATLSVPGHLIQPINLPVLDARDHLLADSQHQINSRGTTWVISDEVVNETIALVWKRVVDNKIALTAIPGLTGSSDTFPYRDNDGSVSLICLTGTDQLNGSRGKSSGWTSCPICASTEKKVLSDMRSHMGTHILRAARGISEPKETVERVTGSLPCGFCGKTGEAACNVSMKELSKSIQYTSNCPRFEKFNYGPAEKGSNNRPCRNVPIICKLCAHNGRDTDFRPAIWRYNMEAHLDYYHDAYAHPGKPDGLPLPRVVYEAMYLTEDEQRAANVSPRPVFTNILEKENESIAIATNARAKKRRQDAETFGSAARAATGKRARGA